MDDDDEDEVVYTEELSEDEVLDLAANFPIRHSPWIYLSLILGVIKELLGVLEGGVHALETIIHQRYTWEQERQEFSDSVKTDFLTLPTAQKGDTDAATE